MEWQPIETAPKNGLKDVLLYCADGDYKYTIGLWIPAENRWYSNDYGDGELEVEATHWMFLPEPPTTESH